MPYATPNPTGTAEAHMLDLELAEPRPSMPVPDPLDDTDADHLPGSGGEHLLQCAYGSRDRAKKFYDDQLLDHLNEAMMEFVGRMDMAFVATADAAGECDASFRAGLPGFIHVLDSRHVAYPEYRGNGVHASLGNVSENPHMAIFLVDFFRDLIGLHINGRASVVEDTAMRTEFPDLPAARHLERWVVVEVEEAYVHCRKHVPHLQPVDRTRDWGTDDVKRKGGDYFSAKGTPRPWHGVVQTSGA